jgi:hypothetical protein
MKERIGKEKDPLGLYLLNSARTPAEKRTLG